MKSEVSIYLYDKIKEPLIIIDSSHLYDVEISIVMKSNTSLESVLKNKSEFLSKYKEHVRTLKDFFSKEVDLYADEGYFDRLDSIKNYRDLIASIQNISFNYCLDMELTKIAVFDIKEPEDRNESFSKIREFIFKNDILKKFKIIIPEKYEELSCSEIKSIYEGYDYLVKKEDSVSPLTLEQIDKASYFDELCDDIKDMNLSPLENITLVYDMIRERQYKITDDSDTSKSRDRYQILNGDEIVCAGYSRIMFDILTKLGIRCLNVGLRGTDGEGGHERVSVFVDDSKYGVKGLFVFDPTFDGIRNTDENKDAYLYRYVHFMKNLDFFHKIDSRIQLENQTYPLIDDFPAGEFKKQVERIKAKDMSDSTPDERLNYIRNIDAFKLNFHTICTFKNIISLIRGKYTDKYEAYAYAKEHMDEITSLITCELDKYTAYRLLITVRAIENKLDEDKYPLDVSDLYFCLRKSFFKDDIDKIPVQPKCTTKSTDIDSRDVRDYVVDWNITKAKYLMEALELADSIDNLKKLELYKKN